MLSCRFAALVAAALLAGLPQAVQAQMDLFSGFSFSSDLPVFLPPSGQGGPARPVDGQPEAGVSPDLPQVPSADALWLPLPYAPPNRQSAPQTRLGELVLEARLTQDGDPLADGLQWRVFGVEPDGDGVLPLVASMEGGSVSLTLEPGSYLVHAGFGRAGATKRLTVGAGRTAETFLLEAGALRLGAVVGDDQPLPSGRVRFEVSRQEANGARRIVLSDARPGRVLRLEAGTYHVVSRYGTLNAVVRADIEVRAGKLTEATVRHKAAEATLKLVAETGGEALANTGWTVLTRDGDTIHESVGAFPRIVLSEGSYTAVARHKGRIYARDFVIEAGLNRDIEVRLADEVRPEASRPPRR